MYTPSLFSIYFSIFSRPAEATYMHHTRNYSMHHTEIMLKEKFII